MYPIYGLDTLIGILSMIMYILFFWTHVELLFFIFTEENFGTVNNFELLFLFCTFDTIIVFFIPLSFLEHVRWCPEKKFCGKCLKNTSGYLEITLQYVLTFEYNNCTRSSDCQGFKVHRSNVVVPWFFVVEWFGNGIVDFFFPA